ncbi:unnamed protein product [marine sediment metagenome]|uniref:Phage tail protein n=1 Tax=marine sediment metagenome TaxID=412755 RepID=X0YYS9_9ZZZZ
MTKPYKAKNVLVKVGSDIVGVVENMSVEFIREGGIEPHYGSETGKHAIGTKHAIFTLRRWMFIDTKKKLLFDLFDLKTQFSLVFGISDMTADPDFVAGMYITLSDCVGYRWRPITGAANDIVAEELIGEAVDWDDTNFDN